MRVTITTTTHNSGRVNNLLARNNVYLLTPIGDNRFDLLCPTGTGSVEVARARVFADEVTAKSRGV